MKGYIYNVETKEVVLEIAGESNKEIEAAADARGYTGVDEYGLSYNDNGLFHTIDTEYVEA
jgi:hypothetical protein